jgi:glycosyltransferase involved in cell wall biosynthesis
LLDALDELMSQKNNFHLLVAGPGQIETIGIRSTLVGPVGNDVFLSYLYSACDVFVCPSTQDNLPNTVLEALACKVPVIGFAIGGLPDLITTEQNGWLVKLNGGSAGLRDAIEISSSAKFKVNAGEVPLRNDLHFQAQNYIRVYKTFLTK